MGGSEIRYGNMEDKRKMNINSKSILAVCSLLYALSASAADVSPSASANTVDYPRMTRDEALRYLDENKRPAPLIANLPDYILSADAKTVEAMLAAGLDPNEHSDNLSQSPLEIAAMSCADANNDIKDILRTIEVLLAHKANIRTNHPDGRSVLFIAAQNCPSSIVKRLLKAGADHDKPTEQGFTPLSMALILSNYDAAEALIEAGARLSEETSAQLLAGNPDDARLKKLLQAATKK